MIQGGGPRIGHVLLVGAAAIAIACVIGNGLGHRDGCSAQGKTTRVLECVDKEEK
jgi:hypothetical protein